MDNTKIISIRENPDQLDLAVSFFSSKWAIPQNVYHDCIANSIITKQQLPRWYLLLIEGDIKGGYGIITNDFISRQDLWPWLCALYVEKDFRNQGYGKMMLEHARMEAGKLGFSKLYISTDHIGYYEKHGFDHIATGYDHGGESTRIYEADCYL